MAGIQRFPSLQSLLSVALFSLGVLWLGGCTPFHPVTVPQILEMTREGVPPNTIIARIKESNTVYRLHAHQVAQLSRDGVNDKVLDYMQQTYLDAVRRDQSGAKPPERTPVREEASRLRTPLVAFLSILLLSASVRRQ